MMSTETAIRFRKGMDEVREALLAVRSDLADVPWRPNGWTRKQIVGHLLDSAANNRQRFVRAALDGAYSGPGYAQDAWVELQGYAEQSWETLLRWWQAEHEMLAAIVDRIPTERLGAQCVIGGDKPVTLAFVIDDYVRHQKHHLGQITA
ncbi:DinB family protein [Occallatibacter riparius]|uniref:DinB family protein n=1 Tax=Occallatibacter riparius TaxID=1002689 RepID=A0A9J7BR46_9BACT|nr:DinB family protein [Occallatibacter riparius]UWZ85348.1 DinB family protein [Occallatibacter riparius]